MTAEAAQALYQLGRAHAMSGSHLYGKALDYASAEGFEDPDDFAFNGTFSLSTYYLLSLGIELLLKAAYVASGGPHDDKHLRNAIGHDLKTALARATEQGFASAAPRLTDIIEVLNEPYTQHFFRYSKPETMGLPVVPEIVEALVVLEREVEALVVPLDAAQ